MIKYEHIFLARQDISAQQVEALADQFKSVLEEHGGSVTKIENWGLRTSTYRIKKNRKAHYILMNVDAPAAAVSEMERQMRINDDVLRYLTLRVEEHDDGPSAMMKKGDRDVRPRRGNFMSPRAVEIPSKETVKTGSLKSSEDIGVSNLNRDNPFHKVSGGYFYEKQLTNNDQELINAIESFMKLFDYELEKPAAVNENRMHVKAALDIETEAAASEAAD